MPKKNRLSLEVSVNGDRRTLAVLPGKGVVQSWVVAERLGAPDRVTLHLTALDTTVAGTDTFSRWRKVKLRAGDSVEIRVLTTQIEATHPSRSQGTNCLPLALRAAHNAICPQLPPLTARATE